MNRADAHQVLAALAGQPLTSAEDRALRTEAVHTLKASAEDVLAPLPRRLSDAWAYRAALETDPTADASELVEAGRLVRAIERRVGWARTHAERQAEAVLDGETA